MRTWLALIAILACADGSQCKVAKPNDGFYSADNPPEGIAAMEATVEGELITLHIVFDDGTEKTVSYDYFSE